MKRGVSGGHTRIVSGVTPWVAFVILHLPVHSKPSKPSKPTLGARAETSGRPSPSKPAPCRAGRPRGRSPNKRPKDQHMPTNKTRRTAKPKLPTHANHTSCDIPKQKKTRQTTHATHSGALSEKGMFTLPGVLFTHPGPCTLDRNKTRLVRRVGNETRASTLESFGSRESIPSISFTPFKPHQSEKAVHPRLVLRCLFASPLAWRSQVALEGHLGDRCQRRWDPSKPGVHQRE